jgi:hypothetical protein
MGEDKVASHAKIKSPVALRQRLDQNKSGPIDSCSLYKIAHITLLICGHLGVISGHGDLVTNTDIRVTLC